LVRVPFQAEANLMKPMMRKVPVRWTGGARDGRGAMTTENGMLKQGRYFSDTASKKKVHMSFRGNADGSLKLEMETLPLQSFEEDAFEVRVALKPKVAATQHAEQRGRRCFEEAALACSRDARIPSRQWPDGTGASRVLPDGGCVAPARVRLCARTEVSAQPSARPKLGDCATPMFPEQIVPI
jgi:hypothetical protein